MLPSSWQELRFLLLSPGGLLQQTPGFHRSTARILKRQIQVQAKRLMEIPRMWMLLAKNRGTFLKDYSWTTPASAVLLCLYSSFPTHIDFPKCYFE